ncbi:MAG: hypothetical protein ACLFV6_00725 [Spirulinaceae cyanobacterium]
MKKQAWCLILSLGLGLASCQTTPPSDTQLPPPPTPETTLPSESDREAFANDLMTKTIAAINTGDADFLGSYLIHEPEIARDFALAAIADYQTYFEGNPIENYEYLGPDTLRPDTLKFKLMGGNISKEISVSFQQEKITIYDEFFSYSARSKNLLSRMIESLQQQDAAELAKVLTADDIDYPVTKAESAIANYQKAVDPQTLTFEFIGFADASPNSPFVYRLSGTKDNQPISHDVKVIYGDGLVGLQDDWIPALN